MFHEKLDLKLIHLVKENPVLYDFNNAKYMDFNAREVAWQKIGDELKRPAAVCKLRWINIRDVNRRILRKKLSSPGARGRMYKYENDLAFMRPFYRDVTISIDNMDGVGKEEHAWNDEDFDDMDNTVQNDSDESQKIVKQVTKPTRTSKRKKKKTTLYEEEEKPIPPVTEEPQTDFDPADPVDAFLLSIGATLKTFSPYHLNLAKSKIFAVVQEHDLEQIVQKSNDVKVSASDSMYIPEKF